MVQKPLFPHLFITLPLCTWCQINEFPCIAAIIAVTFQTKAVVFESVEELSNCVQHRLACESTKGG